MKNFARFPLTPADSIKESVEAAGDQVRCIRGKIDVENEQQLKDHPLVIDVWVDATIEPFEQP